ncbi:uncharacterized protein LOC119389062 [Rhipicephalus sanguineus]|uniref:uncharacterized protein LOC119389062 n=1 Tax=Rhipicephalus sanguineus TaxID=34632 RepID=UPI0020C33BB7|nr:uncharacterized protein LOC119389062 [Rhipicephalus sanguineus]
MRIRSVPLFVLGFSVLFQLLDGVAGEQCQKKIWRRLGLTGFLSGCRYWCRGFLPRIGYEKDGTPCTRFFRSGVCRNGSCITDVPPDPSLQTTSGTPGGQNSRGVAQSTGGDRSTVATRVATVAATNSTGWVQANNGTESSAALMALAK